ncbi:DUF1240 domain-containing protein [Yokenella regensburgei]|uniref:DUF1240 domain-containing protein n=1 Tax=Yokenella regensburgei TaxID=158877 RepID=UPI003ED9630B
MINNQFIKIKLASFLLLVISSIMIWFILLGPVMVEFSSIIQWSDIIITGKASMIGIGALPITIYILILSLRNIFNKSSERVNDNTLFDVIAIPVVGVSFIVGLIATFILWLALALSPYIRCNISDDAIQNFYVTDQSLCKTIDPHAYFMHHF